MRSEENILRSAVKIPFTEEDKNRVKGFLSPKINWLFLINLASNCDILPIFAQNLLSVGSHYIPNSELNEIAARYRREYTINNVILWNEFKKILEIANKKQISIIPIKGIVLSELLYNELGLRQISDIDFLIQKEDLLKIEPELAELGYISLNREYYLKNHWHCAFEKNGPMGILVVVDAHWDVLLPYRRINNLINDFWNNSIRQNVSGENILTLSFENLLFACVVELYKDISGARRFFLKRHLDISRILYLFGQKINWREFIKRTNIYGLKPLVYYALSLNEKSFRNKALYEEILGKLKPSFCKRICIFSIMNKISFSQDNIYSPLKYILYCFISESILLSRYRVFLLDVFNLAYPEIYLYKKSTLIRYIIWRTLKIPGLLVHSFLDIIIDLL